MRHSDGLAARFSRGSRERLTRGVGPDADPAFRSWVKASLAHALIAFSTMAVAAFVAALHGTAQAQPVTVIMVRHAEADQSQPTVPLTEAGRQRARVLGHTLRNVRFTHIIGTHTTRTQQTAEPTAVELGLPVVQLPSPGSMMDGAPITDQTSRRIAIEPVATALLQLPPGSTVLAVLNSENIYAILNRLGIPSATPEQSCVAGGRCVPCTDNSCYPRDEYDKMWHLVRDAGTGDTLAFIELRYGVSIR